MFNIKKGKSLFIVVEGIDGSGKTSLVKNFCKFLRKRKISFISNFEPTNHSIFGVVIRKIIHKKPVNKDFLFKLEKEYIKLKKIKGNSSFIQILGRAVCKVKKETRLSEIERQTLFIADRYFDLKNIIKPALQKGKIVLQDRFDISSAAYALGIKKVSPSIIFRFQKEVLDDVYCIPHIKIFMDIEPSLAIKRIKKERGEISVYEKLKKLQKIRKAYLRILLLKKKEGKTIYCKIAPEKNEKEIFQEVLKSVFNFPSDKSL